jgi:hypothetical protein
MWLSLVMFASYLLSSFIGFQSITLIKFFWFDVFTLAIIIFIGRFFSRSSIYDYLIIGLTLNSLLFLGMHYDMIILRTYHPWWFWSVYSIGMNFINLAMIAIFFIRKYFLGLVKIKIWLLNSIIKRNVSG